MRLGLLLVSLTSLCARTPAAPLQPTSADRGAMLERLNAMAAEHQRAVCACSDEECVGRADARHRDAGYPALMKAFRAGGPHPGPNTWAADSWSGWACGDRIHHGRPDAEEKSFY